MLKVFLSLTPPMRDWPAAYDSDPDHREKVMVFDDMGSRDTQGSVNSTFLHETGRFITRAFL
jgi:hypothetical protein